MIPTPERVGQSARNWFVWLVVPSSLGGRDVRLFIVRKP